MSYLRGLAVVSLVVLGFANCYASAAPEESNIKLIIDVSGSMKKNDPENLRRPAVNLLMNLLPPDANAGVWLFGDRVEVLVPFGRATEAFKSQAVANSPKIHSNGLLTDVGAALEQSMISPPQGGKAILLSDGMVDIGTDAAVNAAESLRIRNRLVPRLRSVGAEIHTVALSDQADKEVLSEIALGTGGLFETANTPEDLTRIFLRLFDDSVLQDRLPLENGVFLVDSSVEEFTLLAFHQKNATPIQLRSPDNEYYLASDHPSFVNWYQDAGYDLVTIARPIEGEWKLFADEDPQNRITAVSDLKLRVTNLENMIHEEAVPSLDVQFYQAGGMITEPAFLDLMDVQLIVLTPAGKRIAKTLDEYVNGTFSSDLGVFAEPGRYRISVSVDGRTFKREVVQEVEYGSAAKVVFTPSTGVLTVRPMAVGMLDSDMRLIARVVDKDGKKKLVPMRHDGDMWVATLNDVADGDYDVTVHVKGVASTGQSLDFDLPAMTVDVASQSAEAEEVVEESFWSLDNHMLLGGIGLGNLLIIGLILWYVRRRPADAGDPEVEALISSVEVDPNRAAPDSAAVEAALNEAKAMQQGGEVPTPEPEAAAPTEVEPVEEPELAEVEVEVPPEPEVETAPESEEEIEEQEVGEGLSDIVDGWNTTDEEDDDDFPMEPETAEDDSEEVDENAQTVKFDAPETDAEAELEADMEAAIDEEPANSSGERTPDEDIQAEALDENARTVQLDEPNLPSEGDDDDELPVDTASSG